MGVDTNKITYAHILLMANLSQFWRAQLVKARRSSRSACSAAISQAPAPAKGAKRARGLGQGREERGARRQARSPLLPLLLPLMANEQARK